MELYLIRHAEMHGDPHREYEPPVEGCLSEQGVRQASALGRTLAETKFDAIYSSPLGRAVQTAQALAKGSSQSIRIAPWLIEWRPATVLGEVGEDYYSEVSERAAQVRPEECWKTPAGEGTLDMAQRVIVGFQRTLAGHGMRAGHGGYLMNDAEDSQRIALIAHGGSLARLAAFLLGIPLHPFAPLAFSYCGVAVFQFIRRVDVWYPTLVIPS